LVIAEDGLGWTDFWSAGFSGSRPLLTVWPTLPACWWSTLDTVQPGRGIHITSHRWFRGGGVASSSPPSTPSASWGVRSN